MRAFIHSLAVLAVILSGITAGDMRALAGAPSEPVETIVLLNDIIGSETAKCCDDGEISGPKLADNDTSECHTTSVFLIATHASIYGTISSRCFETHTERANGTSLTPTGPPPKFSA